MSKDMVCQTIMKKKMPKARKSSKTGPDQKILISAFV